MYGMILPCGNIVARKGDERIMRKNVLRMLVFVGYFFFAGFQLLSLAAAIGLGFELFPRWPLLAVGVGFLVFSCCFTSLLWLERKELFGLRETRQERLSTWLILLGVNAIVEAFALFFLNMIVVQPLASWLNGTFQVDELVISFIFLLLLVVGGMVVALYFLSQRSKTKGKE